MCFVLGIFLALIVLFVVDTVVELILLLVCGISTIITLLRARGKGNSGFGQKPVRTAHLHTLLLSLSESGSPTTYYTSTICKCELSVILLIPCVCAKA